MKIGLTFLGTGCMMPTKDRSMIAMLLSYANENILIDCGEGTQRQFRLAGIKPTKITKILITHWHGDHTLGLAGLLQTLTGNEYSGTLELYGPEGSKTYVKKMFEMFKGNIKLDLKVFEISSGKFFESQDFYLEALPLKHSTPCLGYSFVEKDKHKIQMEKLEELGLKRNPLIKKLQVGEDIKWEGKIIKASEVTSVKKGKKVTFILDTLYCENAIKLAKEADVLICESTHDKALKAKAKEYNHLTSEDAATIAKKAKVDQLVLTHFSQRYKHTSILRKEAKMIFSNVVCAKDFLRFTI
ncbi:MAG: ribonuclease Z [archaeon]